MTSDRKPGADLQIEAAPKKPEPKGPDRLVGKTIGGRFVIQREIARGGMGKVYLAEQTPLGRPCAVKVLSPKYADDDDPEFQKRFFLEAATAAKLSHPNTVTIYDYGRDGDVYFIAMEYLEGRTLYQLLREEGPLPEPRVARLVAQAASSLREAHASDIIHRDIKPANMMVVDRGPTPDHIKLLDFGLVKDIGDDREDLTQEGLFMGSPKYMAPEQILGNGISPRTDVYALGAVAYELLCGHVPFDKGSSVKTLMAHVNDPVPPLATYLPGLIVSAAMQSLLDACLVKDPAARLQDMDAVLARLASVDQEGDQPLAPSEATPPSGVPRSVPPSSVPAMPGPMPGLELMPPSLRGESAESTEAPAAPRYPSATPAPMALETPPKSKRRAVILGAAAVACLGVIAIVTASDEEPPSAAATTVMPTGTVAVEATPAAGSSSAPASTAEATASPTTSATAAPTASASATAATSARAPRRPRPTRPTPPSPSNPDGYKDSPY